MSINAMKKMVAALEESLDLVEQDYDTDWRHGLPTRKAQLDGKLSLLNAHKEAIAAGRAAIEAAERQKPVAKVKKCHMDDRDWFDIDPLMPHDNFTNGQLLYTIPQAERQEPMTYFYRYEDGVTPHLRSYAPLEAIPLYTAPQQPAIPDGWVLVPVEPTPEMQRAMQRAEWPDEAYKAMLAAAPKEMK